jgi:hypothetical protein
LWTVKLKEGFTFHLVLALSLACKEIIKEPSLSANPVNTQGFNIGLLIKVEYFFI